MRRGRGGRAAAGTPRSPPPPPPPPAGPEPSLPRRLGVLSTAQLRALLHDEPRLQRLVRLSRKFQSLQLEREMCLVSNYTMAKENLSLRPRLENGKASLAIKYQELREIKETCWDKQQRLGTYLEKWSPQSALVQLQANLNAFEAESEAQVEKFLSQDLPLDSFLESFCQSRTRSHICRTQLEKLQELLQKDKLGRVPACPARCPGAPTRPARACLAPLQSRAAPKAFCPHYGLLPAYLIPSEAIVPFPVPAAPPSHHLPALGHQPPVPRSKTPGPGLLLRFIRQIPLLSPQPFRVQQLPHQQKQEPPHR